MPFLLRGTLREYQHIGLDWLVTMYDSKLNGILADEMGLGKTIQTISLLAHLACQHGIWGPHLIVVPTSVMLNWEREFKMWCPGLKILTYYGSQKERKQKRLGWSKPNAFHVCITSYNLITQDQHSFKRKRWKYLILDEAQNIKNFRSQRWQTLLTFNAARRLLLTGTPLQNNLMELWSLMHFLMPHIFQSHSDFRDWFCNPVSGMIDGTEAVNRELISRLHGVLRPFILRRLKKDVEQQLPNKHEHVVPCQLSKRQRILYDEFISKASTQDTLRTGHFLGIMNVLMQLRKVCNHPDLFEDRPILSPFVVRRISLPTASLVTNLLPKLTAVPHRNRSLLVLDDLVGNEYDDSVARLHHAAAGGSSSSSSSSSSSLIAAEHCIMKLLEGAHHTSDTKMAVDGDADADATIPESLRKFEQRRKEREVEQRADLLSHVCYINRHRTHASRTPIYGTALRELVTVRLKCDRAREPSPRQSRNAYLTTSSTLRHLVPSFEQRLEQMHELIVNFTFVIPRCQASTPELHCSHPSPSLATHAEWRERQITSFIAANTALLRPAMVRFQLSFPDRRLLQFDCGKLQKLAVLLRDLKANGTRSLTQLNSTLLNSTLTTY